MNPWVEFLAQYKPDMVAYIRDPSTEKKQAIYKFKVIFSYTGT